jgi:hypothetical protein
VIDKVRTDGETLITVVLSFQKQKGMVSRMRLLADLPTMVDQMPGWAQIVVGILLVVFSLASIYGRVNVDFGSKIFSRIPKEELKSNIGHIFGHG